tara:strand:+ start:197 stop:457 length:261 start_codon:yes stop_codon:yes gene_type:complete
MDSAKMPRILKEIEVGKSTTTFNPDRDRERKEKLNMRKLKTLIAEYEFLSNKFRGSIPRCVRNRLSRLEDVINVKTAIYEEALKND